MTKISSLLMVLSLLIFNAARSEEEMRSPLAHYARAGACLFASSLIWGLRSGDISTPLFAKVASKGPLSWLVASSVTIPMGIYGIMQISLGNAKYNAAELQKIRESGKLP